MTFSTDPRKLTTWDVYDSMPTHESTCLVCPSPCFIMTKSMNTLLVSGRSELMIEMNTVSTRLTASIFQAGFANPKKNRMSLSFSGTFSVSGTSYFLILLIKRPNSIVLHADPPFLRLAAFDL